MLAQFITALVPRDGGRAFCLAVPDPTRGPGKAVMLSDAASIARATQQAVDGGLNCWVTPCCYDGPNRTAKDAVDGRMIGVDVDLKSNDPTKPVFASKDEAARVVQAGVAAGLPAPTYVVDSGNGLHLWYEFDQPFDTVGGRNSPYAAANEAIWAGLSAFHPAFEADTTSRGDLSRLLRMPGSFNMKDPANPKRVDFYQLDGQHLSTGKTVDAASLGVSLLISDAPRGQWNSSHIPPMQTGVAVDDFASLRRASFAPVFNACGMLQEYSTSHRGTIDYDLWWKLIRWTTLADDGREWAHWLSQGHDAYSPADTDRKFDQLNNGDTPPPFCSTVAGELDPERTACLSCPVFQHRLRWPHENPDSLATPTPEPTPAPAPEPAPVAAPEVPLPVAAAPATPALTPPDRLLGKGRFIAAKGYMTIMQLEGRDDDDGAPKPPQVIASNWIWAERPMADASGVHGILFKTVHEVNGTPVVRDVHVPSSAIAADYKALATAFANEGIAFRAIYPKEQHGVRAFILAEFEAVKGEPVAKVVTHLGWQDDGSFATGGLLVTPTGVQSAVTAGSAKTGERRFKPAGTLQAQFDMLRTYSEHGSDAAKFVMACAVGSPAHGIEGRGAPLTVLTGETNLGKTAVCRAAMSIWCNPSETILTPNDTLAASHDRAGTLRNLPIVQDEVTYNDIQGLAAMVHALSSGGDRATMLQNQTLRPNAPRWATAAFWTSNTSIVAQLAGVSHANDAVANRVFELRLTEPTLNVPDMDTLAAVNTGYQKNCGHLGIELAKHYVSNRAMLAKRHEDFGAVVTKVVPGGLTGPLRYWAQLAQTFLSGAAILNELGYMMLDQATAMSILGRLMASAEDQSTSRRSSALGTIRDFLTAHAESTVQIVYKPGPVVQGMERAKDIYLPSGRGAVARIEMTSGAAYYDVLIAKSYLTEWLARRSGELNAMVSKAFSEGLMVSATDASGVADLYEGAVRVDRNNSGHAAGFVDVEVVRFRVPTSSTKATPVDVPDDETNVVAFPPLHGGV